MLAQRCFRTTGYQLCSQIGTPRRLPIPSALYCGIRPRRQRGRGCSAGAAGASEQQSDDADWRVDNGGNRMDWQRDDLHVVLVHPQIPQNAGSVARTCAATAVALHMVGPLGFDLDSKKLKRAGLDYWSHVCVKVHPTWDDFAAYWAEQPGPKRMLAFSKFGTRHYAGRGMYKPGDWLLFGAETTGLPPEAHEAARTTGAVVKIPIIDTHVRSINLAVSAGVGLYEAIRQLDDPPAEAQLPPYRQTEAAGQQ